MSRNNTRSARAKHKTSPRTPRNRASGNRASGNPAPGNPAPGNPARRNRRRPAPSTEPESSLPDDVSRSRTNFWQRVKRPLLLAFKIAAVGLVAAGAWGGYRLLERYVTTAPAFAIKLIEISGDDRVSQAMVRRTAGIEVGHNVFVASEHVLRRRLLRHPWIAEARVYRRLPDKISIEIEEHRAVAMLAMEGLYLVGSEATVFKPVEAEDPHDLPVVTGVDRARFTRNRAYRTSMLLKIVALMHDYRSAGLWRREPISEIHVEDDKSLTLYVNEDAMRVGLGKGPYLAKLRKLRRVLDRLKEDHARAEYVHLDNLRRPDRVTVRLKHDE